MRKLNSSHWENVEELEGLLFFAQVIDEMLFDYTLDSYKPLALNCRLLCVECLSTIEEVRNGFMPKKNLQSIIEELRWSLDKDWAAKELLGKKFDFYKLQLKPNDIKLNELENTISFLYNHFNDKKYLEQIKITLKSYIENKKEKSKIKYLTGSLLTELINYGYHPHHIDYQNYQHFFNSSKKSKIDNIDNLNEFFSIFNFESSEYTVVFIGSILFKEFKKTLNGYNIVVTKTYNCFSKIKEDIDFEKSRLDLESFIICSKVKDLDHHSAMESSEKFLGQVTNLFNFFHHKQKPEIKDKCVVSRNSDNYVVVIDKPIKSVLKTKNDEYPDVAAQSVEKVLETLELRRESTYRFSRSIDLHSAALTASALENQILDLWAALETLIPKSIESNQDRIVQLSEKLIPFLQINYIEKQFKELLSNLKNWNKEYLESLLNEVKCGITANDLEKIAALITLSDNKNLRLELYKELKDYPLLKNRIYSIHQLLNSPKNIKKALKNHEIKLNWHLRRIYRTRSLIVHSGSYPTYTPILIEHLHNYLDILISKVVELVGEMSIDTLEQVILEVKIILDYHNDLLEKHISEDLTLENYKESLLGIE
ncbi:hypothetical protein [Aequorivita nionensis]|uniref:hypothetical protein n=1 Tax=Aequorivita nionensis TaxID=1287690 RepID=UPI003965C209